MERELKLQVLHPDLWDTILQHPLVDLGSYPPEPLHALYYDSSDGQLRRAGIAYRVRREGAQWVATIKLSGSADGGLHQRPEWNQSVDDRVPDLTVFAEPDLVERLTPFLHLELLPVLETEFARRERRVVQDDGSVVILAADRGEIRAGGQTLPICELELELAQGNLAPLLQLGSSLCAALPLCPDGASKFARGLALLGRQRPTETLTSPPMRARQDAGQAFSQILIGMAQQLLDRLMPAAGALDSRSLHELRRSVRALRAVLRFAKGLDPDDQLRGVRNGLAVWFHEAGTRRDLDALAAHWLDLASTLELSPEPLHTALLRASDPSSQPSGRVDQRARLAAELLALWAILLANPLAQGESLRDYAETRLKKMDHYLQWQDPQDVAGFHRLRIALKNWRYTLLALAPLWPSKDSKALLKVLASLQASAGLIRDAQLAPSYLPDLAKGKDSNLSFQAGMLLGNLHARQQREIKKLAKHWERLQDIPRPWDS